MRTGGVIVFLLLLAGPWAQAENPLPPDFQHYPQTEAFQAAIRFQTDEAADQQLANLLAISVFRSNGAVLMYVVGKEGQERDVRRIYKWADQASHQKQLTPSAMQDLRGAIHELPTESVLPPIEHLVVVSFAAEGAWITRSYDSQALPPAMRRIYEIIGERFETQERP